MRINARTDEALLERYRVVDFWENTLPAATVVTDILAYHPSITAGTLNDGGREVKELAARYDSLFDCLEQVRQQTGLLWDVTGSQVNLYPFGTSPAIVGGDYIDGSLTLTISDDNLGNVGRMLAWEYLTFDIFCPPCKTFAKLPIKGGQWQSLGDVEELTPYFPPGFYINTEAGEAQWRQEPEMDDALARVTVRRPKWVEMSNQSSIDTYGRRDIAPLSDNGGTSVDGAADILTELLRRKADPEISVTGVQPLQFGHRVGTMCEILGHNLLITRLTREWDATAMIVTFDAETHHD
jgi:hypothetical protein